ncbi:MAG: TolC family protein [Sphingopyxis sp.]|nr:TolC family protein [Sphingopyxis sp.]
MTGLRFGLATGLSLTLAACAGPQTAQPEPLPAPPAAWSTTADTSDEQPKLDWWTELGDPELDRLVARARLNNADLRAATANLKAAGELVREARAARFPTGTIDASASRARTAGAALQLDTVGGPAVLPSQTLIETGATLSWEIDLAGRLAAIGDAANAISRQESWLRRGVEASVAASVVRAWADLAESERRLTLLTERDHLLADVALRVDRAQRIGGARRDELVDTQRALGALQAERPALETARRNALRRLATLTGTPAPSGVLDFAGLKPRDLPVPQFVRAGRPERILRFRPDVAAAEQDLIQAMARVRIARADLYPRINLFGSLGISAVPDRLTDAGALRFGIGPMLSWGLFDMDRIRARIRSEGAMAEAAGAHWESIFMTALEETDAALDGLKAARETAGIAGEDLTRATQLADMAQVRHRAGQDSFLMLAASRDRQLIAATGALHAEHAALSAWIDLQTALGAGWRD